MRRHATKDHSEREDEESERLVREAPKLKPPRHDKKREGIRPDQDPDVAGDPDLKSKDKSLNYKQVGGSDYMFDLVSHKPFPVHMLMEMLDEVPTINKDEGRSKLQGASSKVAARYLSALTKEEKIPVKKKDTGKTVFVTPTTLKEKPGEYEELKSEEDKPSDTKVAPKEEAQNQQKNVGVPPEQKVQTEGGLPEGGKTPEAKKPKKKKEKAPKSDKGDSEKGQEEEKEEPSVSEKLGFEQPKRREVSSAERVESNYALASTLPPDIAAELIASKIHPDDARQLVKAFKAAQAREVGNASSFASKVKGFYETNPDRIEPPSTWKTADGKKVDFEGLPPDEKADAYRQHQMQVLAFSLAARDQISKRLQGKKGDVDPEFATALTESLLGTTKANPEKVFDAMTKSNAPLISKESAKALVASTKNDPQASELVRKYLEANDYRAAKEKFLGGTRGFTEDDSPSVIVDGLLNSRKFFAGQAKSYGVDAEDNTGSKHFEVQVLSKLKSLDPDKYQQVQDTLNAVAAVDYDKAKKSYERDLKRWESKPEGKRGDKPTEPVEPFGYASTRKPEDLRREGQGLWDDLLGRSGTKKTAAQVAYRHIISSYLKGIAMAKSSSQTKEALYHGIDPAENYPAEPYRDWQPAHQRDLGESDYEIILTSAAEWLDSPVLTQGFEAAVIPDQRYRAALDLAIHASPYNRQIDVQTYNNLLAMLQGVAEPGLEQSGGMTSTKEAKSNRGDLESAIFAKMPSDSKRKKGSDLVIMLDESLASKLHKEAYTTVALKSLSDSDLKTLAGALKVKTAGHSHEVETMSLLFYGKGPFNRDVVDDLYTSSFEFRDTQGETHDDGNITIVDRASGPFVTRADEMKGLTQEVLVTVRVPKGSQAEAFKAAQTVAKKHKLQVEKAKPGQKPGLRQSERPQRQKAPGLRGLRASSFAIAGDTSPTNSGPSNGETTTMTTLSQKKASQADNILARFDRIASVVQDKAAQWGVPFEEAKALVNAIDKLADDTETFIYGGQSLARRQAETLLRDEDFRREASAELGKDVISKAARVLQRDADEPYMDTFKNPMQPHQTDADEPYMSAYEDDQSEAVIDGEDASGRELAPEA